MGLCEPGMELLRQFRNTTLEVCVEGANSVGNSKSKPETLTRNPNPNPPYPLGNGVVQNRDKYECV